MKEKLHNPMVLLFLSILFLAAPLRASGLYHAGSGTAADPYQIATAAQLIDLGRHSEDYDKFFVLVADIDLGINAPGGKIFRQAVIAPAIGAVPEGFPGVPFSGTFDGNGFVIRNLTFDYPNTHYVGLFGMIDAAGTIVDIRLEDCSIYGVHGYAYIGSLAGVNRGLVYGCVATTTISISTFELGGLVGRNEGEIVDCHTAGIIYAGSNQSIGGLVGRADGAIVQRCSSTCSVSGSSTNVGGLVGHSSMNSLIIYSYATGFVGGSNYVGGLVGKSQESIVSQCYANNGAIEAHNGSSAYSAGLIGYIANTTVDYCYSTGWVDNGRGLIDYNAGTVSNSFWDIQTSFTASSGGGTGLQTLAMQQQQTFVDASWDFDTVWDIVEGQTYPFFHWQNQQTVVLCHGGQPYPIGDLNADCVVNLEDFLIFTSHWLDDLRP